MHGCWLVQWALALSIKKSPTALCKIFETFMRFETLIRAPRRHPALLRDLGRLAGFTGLQGS
jgi:hypothetical protein